MSASSWQTVFCRPSSARLSLLPLFFLFFFCGLFTAFLTVEQCERPFAEIILLRKLSNCSGCGRGVSAAPLALAHSSHVLGFKWNSAVFIQPDREELGLENRGGEGEEEERRGEERGDGCETTGRWRWAWQKAVSQNQAGWKCYKKSPTLRPPFSLFFFFFKQRWARHAPPDCPSVSENGLCGAKSPAKGCTGTNGRSTDRSCELRLFFYIFFLSLLRHLEPPSATMEEVQRGHANNRRRWNGEGGFTGRNVHFTLFEFLHLDNGQRTESEKQTITDICWQLSERERGAERERERGRREKLHSHIVN